VVLLPLLGRRREGGVALSRTRVRSERRALGALVALSALLSLAACRNGEDDQQIGIGRQEYVDTYIEILLAAELAEDSFAATEAARAILARRGLTEDDLLEFGRRHREDAEYLAEVWSEIEERIRYPEGVDSAGEEGEG
jgi:hypothetical protein